MSLMDLGGRKSNNKKSSPKESGVTEELEFLDLGLDEEDVSDMHVSDETGEIILDEFDLTEIKVEKGPAPKAAPDKRPEMPSKKSPEKVPIFDTASIMTLDELNALEIDADEEAEGKDPDEILELDEIIDLDAQISDDAGEKKSSDEIRKPGTARKKKPQKEKKSAMEFAVVGLGGLIVVAAVVLLIVFLGKRGGLDTPDGDLAGSGSEAADQIASMSPVGTYGIENLAAKKLLDMYEPIEEELVAEETEQTQEETESPADKLIAVKVNLTSVEKDLKVKFVNQATGKLVNNARFSIVLSLSGAELSYSDDDMDGIIYKSAMTPGKYSVSVSAPDGYEIASCDSSVTVKDKIEYKKVDVTDEIKEQSQVAASEDKGNVAQTVEESVIGDLKDTVEYVESSSTAVEAAATYTEIAKDTIANPEDLARLDGPAVPMGPDRSYAAFLAGDEVTPTPEGEGDGPTTEPTSEVTEAPTEAPTEQPTPTEAPTQAPTPTEQPTPTQGATPSPTDTPSPSVSPSPSATPSPSLTPSPTVTAGPAASKLTVEKSEITAFTGRKYTLVATITVGDKEHKSDEKGYVTFKSSDENILKVNAETGEAEAIKAGSVTVTVTGIAKDKDGKELTATIKITVKEDPAKNTSEKLKNKSGVQVYIRKADGSYQEATYADYFTADKFYTKDESKYIYTGWQTIDNKRYYYTKDGVPVTGKQVIQGVEYQFDEKGALYTGATTFGIDVSKWNGNIDWNAVKASGVDFVIIRCGFRGSSVGGLAEDANFKKNIQGATNAGLKVGVYFFSQAINEVEAVEEASAALSLVSGYNLAYPIFIDTEACNGRADKIDKVTRTAVCRAFCQTVQNAGYKAGIYASKSWFQNQLNTSELSSYKIWVAQYATALTYTGHYDMWQYSAKGKINGISGDVDCNYSSLGY